MLNKIRKLQNKKGFTLVELIVVIAIIAILTVVIVPLVGRYSAQATYTTLNEAASEISSTSSSAIASATMMGKLCKAKGYIGSKDGATFTVTASDGASDSWSGAEGAAEPTTPDGKACKAIYDNLKATLPAKAYFYVAIENNAVTGVVYSNEKAVTKDTDPHPAAGFEMAYQFADDDTTPIGATGKFLP